MGTFSNFLGVNESYIDDPNLLPYNGADSLLEDASIEACFEENFSVAASRICYENTVNMNSIFQACAIQEFAFYEETGEELVYEASNGESFFSKVKQFFVKLWEKIQQIFKKAIMMFNTKAKDDKAFYNKYKKEINEAANGSFGDKEVSMYNYVFYDGNNYGSKQMENLFKVEDYNYFERCDPDTSKQNLFYVAKITGEEAKWDDAIKVLRNDSSTDDQIKSACDTLDSISKDLSASDYKTDWYDKLRGDLIKEIDKSYSGDCDSKSFSSDIAEACQGDSSKEDVALSTAVRKAADYLENSKSISDGLDKCLKAWNKELKQIIRDLENLQKEWSKDLRKERTGETRARGYEHTALTQAIQITKETRNIGVAFHGNIMQQIKACSAQSKSICVQAVHYKKPKNESSIYTSESTGSLLDNIELL